MELLLEMQIDIHGTRVRPSFPNAQCTCGGTSREEPMTRLIRQNAAKGCRIWQLTLFGIAAVGTRTQICQFIGLMVVVGVSVPLEDCQPLWRNTSLSRSRMAHRCLINPYLGCDASTCSPK